MQPDDAETAFHETHVSRFIRHPILSVRDLMSTAGPIIALGIILLVAAYKLLDPTPPRHVVLATGGPQGAYAEFGKRYAEELARLA